MAVPDTYEYYLLGGPKIGRGPRTPDTRATKEDVQSTKDRETRNL
jgi:hypothetical protein